MIPMKVRDRDIYITLILDRYGNFNSAVDGVPCDPIQGQIIKKLYSAGDTILNQKVKYLKVAGKRQPVDSVGTMFGERVYSIVLTPDEHQILINQIEEHNLDN